MSQKTSSISVTFVRASLSNFISRGAGFSRKSKGVSSKEGRYRAAICHPVMKSRYLEVLSAWLCQCLTRALSFCKIEI